MSTKDKIFYEALSLFSVHGFSSVSIRDIARAVGIRESAIYKHYKNKQAIFDTIISTASRILVQFQQELNSPFEQNQPDDAAFPVNEIQDIYGKLFSLYLTNDVLSKFRRMMTIEQYENPTNNAVFCEMFIEKTLRYQTRVFRQLIRDGFIQDPENADPEVMALQFYSPVFLLLFRYDSRVKEENEALRLIEHHTGSFFSFYLKHKEADV